jgi:hypothetical protein
VAADFLAAATSTATLRRMRETWNISFGENLAMEIFSFRFRLHL